MTHTQQLTDEYRFYLLRKRYAEELIISAFRGLRRNGIEPILIKGWAAARNYPESVPRFFGDIDLAVLSSDYERAGKLIEGENLGGIDLHRELRHLDTVDWPRLMSNSEIVDLDGESIRVLCAEDHFRVLCVHWLTNGGENRERLWDIVYAVRNRPAEFDWSKCLDVVSPTRRRWVIATVGIAHKYLDLELDGLPFADEAKILPTWLTRCVEREWARNHEIRGLETQLKNPRSLFQQILKRIPPNPIHATIDCEGEFSNGPRIGYQFRNMLKRLLPSVRRVASAILQR
ncbi:MAG: nucleotidyltransferase family protein [Acidobacteriota bacterium]